MGLQEKRLMQEIKDTSIPKFKAAVAQLCGAQLEVEVDWDSFSDANEALRTFDYDALDRLRMALQDICRDDLGKTELGKSFKKYQIKHLPTADGKKLSYADGVLTLQAAFAVDEGSFDNSEMREAIEKGL